MRSSLAAVYHGLARRLELCRFECPAPRDREVLVRMLGCTLCGSDLHSYEGRRTVPVPTILGHEVVGEIVAFGPDAPRQDFAGHELNLGDRVTWAIVANCGQCFYCERGLPQKCLAGVKYGHEPLRPGEELRGGLAEYCRLAAGTAIVRVPSEVSLEVVCPANCATATVAAAVERAGDIGGRSFCVLGLGLLGLTACAMLHSLGASEVIGVDVDESRRARGPDFGASRTVTPDALAETIADATDRRGVDGALELSGAPRAFSTVWPLVRLGGSLILVGAVFPSEPVAIELEQIVRRNLSIHGIHNYRPGHLVDAVRFLASQHRRFPLEGLVSAWFNLSDAEGAFRVASESRSIRVGVRPDASGDGTA